MATAFYVAINWLLLFIYWLLIASITLRIMMKRRSVPSAMAWLLIIYILPLVGIIIYMLLGELNIGKRRTEHIKTMWIYITNWINDFKIYQCMFTNKHSEVADSLFQLCEHRQGGLSGLKSYKIQLLTNTKDAMQILIKDINLAQNNIEMIFYTWQTGGQVDQVTAALIAAAQRGVRCRLILDSAGSLNFFRSSCPVIMRAAGINIVEALHINILRIFFRRMDLRQHRKMILIDNYVAYTGSMNMVDPIFFKKKSGVGQWIDILARMEGPIAAAMGVIFSCDWEVETGERNIISPCDIFKIMKFIQTSGYAIHVIASGPGYPKGVIHQALLISVYSARKQIIITTPYLIPSEDLQNAICTAAQRGVEVHIIIPRNNDSILASWASRSFFAELLEAGVFIHQFNGGLLHTKSVLIDEQLSLIGTVNLDMRSLWLNFEITLVIDDSSFSKKLAQVQKNYITQSNLIETNIWAQRPYWQRIIEKFLYLLSPLL